MRRYRDNLAFYGGAQWPGVARRRERRLVMNYTKAIVDKAAAFTLLGMRPVGDPSGASGGTAPGVVDGIKARRTEAVLAEVAEANDLAGLDYDTEVDASVLGDGAYRVVWDVEAGRVRVTAPDPQGLFVWTMPGDLSRIWRLAHRYEAPEDEPAPLEGALGRASRPRRRQVVEVWTADVFELYREGLLVESKPNPYGWIPYVVYPNVRVPKQFWGESDVAGVRESQIELNRALSQLSMILELSGNPITVLENVTESADIAVTPGAVWSLPEAAKAYLLDLLAGGGVGLHKDYVDLVYRTLHDLGETPRVSFGQAEVALSGVALQLQMDPLLKKVERKRLIRSAAFRRRNEMVLQLLTLFGGEDFVPFRTRVVWGELLPVDRERLVREEVALIGAGVHSRRRAADLVGVEDPDAEFAQWQAEQERVLVVSAPPAAAVPRPGVIV